jgi:hypothetical protein
MKNQQEDAEEQNGELAQSQESLTEHERLESLQNELDDLKTKQKEALGEMAAAAATITLAEQLVEKINLGDSKRILCGVAKKKGDGHCDAPGVLHQGYFCGRHKSLAESDSFLKVKESLMSIAPNFTQVVGFCLRSQSNREQVVSTLQRFIEQRKTAKINAENSSLKIRDDIEKVQGDVKTQKEKVAKLRGARENLLHHILDNELKIHFTHRSGDFGMVGNDCRKVLGNHHLLMRTLEGHQDLQAAFGGLFSRLEAIVEMLYRIEPMSTVELNQEDETEHDGVDEDLEGATLEGDDLTELDLAVLMIRDLQTYYINNFPESNPIPKQHFLVFHATKFLTRWLSLGMFAEQAVENTHSMFNTWRRRFRTLGPDGAWERAIEIHNSKYDSDNRFKRKRGQGRHSSSKRFKT